MRDGFAAKVSNEIGVGIFLVLGKHDDRPLWHYVRVPRLRAEEFKRSVRNGSLDVVKFGEVLFSGWGKEPPEEIQQKIRSLSLQE